MKKITTLFAVVALATTLGLAGCKKDKKTEGDTPPAKTEEPAKTDPAKTEEPAKTDPAKTEEPAKTDPAAGGAASTGVPECDAYLAAVAKYAACDKLPPAVKDATLKGVETMKSTWTADMPAEAKKAAGEACKTGHDAIKTGASAMGCAI